VLRVSHASGEVVRQQMILDSIDNLQLSDQHKVGWLLGQI
jgi:hypothetical protein